MNNCGSLRSDYIRVRLMYEIALTPPYLRRDTACRVRKVTATSHKIVGATLGRQLQ